jgi:hypothetical protein
MNNFSEKNYSEFFKEDLYGGFVDYLINEYGVKYCLAVLRNDDLITKKGIHPVFQKDFKVFLSLNPLIKKEFARNHNRFMQLRNIADENLAFPIDTADESVMVQQKIRIPEFISVKDDIIRATKEMKRSAAPMKGQILKGEWKEKRYHLPKRLTIHLKKGLAMRMRKTTLNFMVNSRQEAISIMIDRFTDNVAYATIQNEEEFVFVKPRNGKIKRSRKLRG